MRYSAMLNARITVKQMAYLEAVAERSGLSVATVIRYLIATCPREIDPADAAEELRQVGDDAKQEAA